MAAVESGTILGDRYRLGDLLGQGGMGAVYRAYDLLHHQQVALKRVQAMTPLARPTPDETVNERLAIANEFRMLASLYHPHVINVLDYGFDAQSQPYFTMTLLDQPRDILAAAADMSRSGRFDLLVQMLRALAYLHRRGVVHRDLKPPNILVTQPGQVKVLDFGLATEGEATEGELAGTLNYISPEVLQEQAATTASDLFAVGVIMAQMFTEVHPFAPTVSGQGLVINILMEPPHLPGLDEDLWPIVTRLLEKDPLDRYPDAETVINALREISDAPIPAEEPAIRESYLRAAAFVGRDDELTRLVDAFDGALNGRGCAYLIGGESGVGKSRLLDELRTRALVQGALVLRGQGVEGGGWPYQLWRDALRQLCLSTPLSDLDASVLKEIVPDLADLLGRPVADPPPLDPGVTQQRLVLTIAEVFRQQTRPILLMLEDLQWADESLEPLKQLNAILSDLPLMIVGSYRTDERPQLPDALPGMQVMPLQRLQREQIIALSRSMLGDGGARQSVVNLLQQETDGNVFFLVEVVRALAEEAGSLHQIGRMTLPANVFAGGIARVIQRRLDRVPDWARPLLERAAVAGRLVDEAVMRHLAGELVQPAPTDLDAYLENWLTVCASAAVLEVAAGQWRFTHDKLHETLTHQLDAATRQQRHTEVAQAIEATHPGESALALTLANHWRAAQRPDQEGPYALQAGEQALRQSLYSEADALLIRAQACFDATGVAFDQAHLWQLRARALQGMGDLNAARDLLEACMARYREEGQDERWLQVMTFYSVSLRLIGDHQRGRDVLQTILDHPAAYDEVRVGAWNNLGILNAMGGNLDEAERLMQLALDKAREIYDRTQQVNALISLGIVRQMQGRVDAILPLYEESLKLVRELGNRQLEAITEINIGRAQRERGELDAARDHLRQAVQQSLAIASVPVALNALINLADIHAEKVDLQQGVTWLYACRAHPLNDEDNLATVQHCLEQRETPLSEMDRALAQANADNLSFEALVAALTDKGA